MKELKVGDVFYSIRNKKITARNLVIKVSDKQVVTERGGRFKRYYNGQSIMPRGSWNQKKENPSIYRLETAELKEQYEKQELIKSIRVSKIDRLSIVKLKLINRVIRMKDEELSIR